MINYKQIYTRKQLDSFIGEYDLAIFEFEKFIIIKELYYDEEIFGFKKINEDEYLCSLYSVIEENSCEESFLVLLREELKNKGYEREADIFFLDRDIKEFISYLTTKK